MDERRVFQEGNDGGDDGGVEEAVSFGEEAGR